VQPLITLISHPQKKKKLGGLSQSAKLHALYEAKKPDRIPPAISRLPLVLPSGLRGGSLDRIPPAIGRLPLVFPSGLPSAILHYSVKFQLHQLSQPQKRTWRAKPTRQVLPHPSLSVISH